MIIKDDRFVYAENSKVGTNDLVGSAFRRGNFLLTTYKWKTIIMAGE